MDPAGPYRPGRARARATDRVEDAVAWLVVTLALATAVAAVVVGTAGYAHVMVRVRAETAGRTPARAVLLEPAGATVLLPESALPESALPESALPGDPAPRDPSDPQRPMARWTTPTGERAVARITVAEPHPPGATVPIWLDRTGRVVPPPEREPAAIAAGAMWGALTAIVGWLALALAWWAVRWVVARRNAAAWAREWRRVEPGWSGRGRTHDTLPE